MIKEAMALDAGDSVDVVAIVYGSVAELSLHVSQLGTQLRREGGGREQGKWETITELTGTYIYIYIHVHVQVNCTCAAEWE